jgi:hypothetical protein
VLGKVQDPWPERLAMLTRSNFEMSSLGTNHNWGNFEGGGWMTRRPFERDHWALNRRRAQGAGSRRILAESQVCSGEEVDSF